MKKEIPLNPEELAKSVESMIPHVGKNKTITFTKKCRVCQNELPAEKFSLAARNADGLKTACKKCDKENNKKYYGEHRESKIERSKKWNQENSKKYWGYQLNYRLTKNPADLSEND